MYKIIDEKLRLASCSLSDLTAEQVKKFLSEWKDGANIGTLTLFYDEDKNMIVLNRDHVDYEYYLQIVRQFMETDEQHRFELLAKAPDCIEEAMEVIDSATQKMMYAQELNRLRLSGIPLKYVGAVEYIRRKVETDCFALMFIFMYGQMCGKREERARRKKHVR